MNRRLPLITRSLALVGLLALTHCASQPQAAPTTASLNPATDYRPVEGEPSIDDIARFLAGRPVRSGAALSEYQRRSDDYHRHALELDYRWRRLGAPRSARQSVYFDQTLRSLTGNPSTIVYPFGGPDILYAASIFPRASTYVLIGLEPVGSVPALDPPGKDPLPLLDRLSRVMDEPVRHGYFITEEMRDAPDVTPILLTSLALMDATVDSVQPISAGGRAGVEVRFRRGGAKRVIYVSADLSNPGFGGGFESWLGQYSGSTAYFKAASYLTHDGSFSRIRDWVLSNCRSVLQDDSGIPYRSYDPASWNVTLLGSYERPIPLFARWRQADLAAAYDAIGGGGPEVPFGSGYHLRIAEANLQVYRRK